MYMSLHTGELTLRSMLLISILSLLQTHIGRTRRVSKRPATTRVSLTYTKINYPTFGLIRGSSMNFYVYTWAQ
ncbi:hypothetical protein BDR03DRAFT_690029 [Suillus americanus]|nr:hypothetical protein BDR03DRAFT_690029 [Suillus americanus]